MIAKLHQVTIEPFQAYDIIVEVTDGARSQLWRVPWHYRNGGNRFTEDDGGDPREAMGKALEELGRSLQLSHGQPLVETPIQEP